MDHLVYLDHIAKELPLLISAKKTMLLRGSMGKKDPHQNVKVGDRIFFVLNKGEPIIRAKALVSDVLFYSDLKWEESFRLVDKYQPKMRLTTALKKKYAGKRFLSFIEVKEISSLDSTSYVKSDVRDRGDWVVVSLIDQLLQKEVVN